MRRSDATMGMCLLIITVVSTGWAQEVKLTDAIPEAASFVIRCKSPRATWAKAADLVDAVQPGFGAAVNGSLMSAGDVIGNPTLSGVDLDKDVWQIVFAESQARPSVVVIVTATDADAAKDGLDDRFQVHVAGKTVIYSEDEDALSEVVKRLKGEGSGLWSKIDVASKKLFDDSDLSVVVNFKQLTEDFSDELDQAEPQLNALVVQMVDAMPDAQRPQLEAIFGMYRTIGKSLLGGVRDSNTIAIGVGVSKTGLRIDSRFQAKERSGTAEYLAKQTPGELAILSKLPADKCVYVGIKGDMSNMMEWSLSVARGLMTDATDEQKADYDKSVKEIAKLKYEELAMYMNLADKSPVMQSGNVSVVSPTDKLRDATRKLTQSMSKFKSAMFTQESILEPGVEKIAGFDVDRVTVKQEFDESADPIGMQKKMQAMMFGESGIQSLVMYQPKRALQTMGGGRAEMEKLVSSIDASTPSSAALVEARRRFPLKSNVIALIDISRLVVNGAKIASEQGLPVNAANVDDLKLPTSYVGFALTCEAGAARTQFEIPVTTAQNIAKIVMQMMSRQ